MPFTLSHPAAVIPLKKYLPLSALVVGSMSPDFEYPLRLAAVSRFSHTLPAVFYFCVPIGLFLLWLFHRLIKCHSLELLPLSIRERITTQSLHFAFWPIPRLFLICLALILGALTHVWWDSLTHEYGYVVEQWPILQVNLISYAGHEIKVFKLLQYLSSVIGLLVLSVSFVDWMRHTVKAEVHESLSTIESVSRKWIALCIVGLTLLSGIGFGLFTTVLKAGSFGLQAFVVQSAIGLMIGFAACIFIYSVLMEVARSQITNR